MTTSERRLKRHLIAALAVKLVALALLWWFFVRDSPVDADAERTAAHVTGATTGSGAKP